jgi:hypothetical protein
VLAVHTVDLPGVVVAATNAVGWLGAVRSATGLAPATIAKESCRVPSIFVNAASMRSAVTVYCMKPWLEVSSFTK